MSKQHTEIEKTFSTKTIEMIDSLLILRESIQAIRNGKRYFIAAVAGQLRALLIDNSRHAEPRFFQMAKHFGLDTKLYYCSVPQVPGDDLLYQVALMNITLDQQHDSQELISLEELLEKRIVFYKDIWYSARTLIELFANRNGGAHYSKTVPRHFSEIIAINFFVGIGNILSDLIVQIADTTLQLGIHLIRILSQQEIHLLLAVPKLPPRDVVLIDANHAPSGMRVVLWLNQRGTPIFDIYGLHGAAIRVTSRRQVDWSETHSIQLTISVTDKLETDARITIDGHEFGRSRSDIPVFLVADPENFDTFLNRSYNGDVQDFEFGFNELRVYNCEMSPIDRARMLLYMEQRRTDPATEMCLYKARSYGHSAAGAADLQNHGEVQLRPLSEIFSSA